VDLRIRLVTVTNGHFRGIPFFTIVAAMFGIAQSLRTHFAGTGIILGGLRAHAVFEDDPGSKVAIDVVREMALAARVAAPRIYLIEDPAPNALAIGRSPNDSVICLTRGLIEQFDREELQGVVAHELAHIRSYDIRLTTLLTVLFANAVSGAISRAIARRLCREREYLADAAAVEFTRNPTALVRALNHFARVQMPLKYVPRSIAPFFFVDPLNEATPSAEWQPARAAPQTESQIFEAYANGAELDSPDDLAAPLEQDAIATHPNLAPRIARIRSLDQQSPSPDESVRALIESIHAPAMDRALSSQTALVFWVAAIGLSAGAIAGALALR
ncbi:MAG TPA: M48 family metalloprotease, partial [Candidatus Binataceae bacterium]|nr:M48 family metalloprotease [Candidatus Binataceae bacterium]